LVRWIGEDKFTVIATKLVITSESIIEGKIYTALFNSKPYEAEIVTLGDRLHCEQVCEYKLNQRKDQISTKSNITIKKTVKDITSGYFYFYNFIFFVLLFILKLK